MKKFEEASKDGTAISNVVEEKINELKKDVKKVEKKNEVVKAMQVDPKKVQEEMATINDRVTLLENSERNLVKKMKKQMDKMREEEAKT